MESMDKEGRLETSVLVNYKKLGGVRGTQLSVDVGHQLCHPYNGPRKEDTEHHFTEVRIRLREIK